MNQQIERILFALLIASCASADSSPAQQRTVGLFLNEAGASDGYTLVQPALYPAAYLVNLEGHVVHQWNFASVFTAATQLMPDGRLLRASASPDSWTTGAGLGGRVEILNWDGSPYWQFDYVSDEYMLHHDVVPMPNGNVLALVWDLKDMDAIEAAGFDTDRLQGDATNIWSERIVEFRPIPPNDAEIVWQWDVWDHLIQDYAPLADNFDDDLARNPQRIDINLSIGGDWLHFNALDYDPVRDIIAVSASYLSEIWVIDHSTTQEEARTNSGGTFGLGGDLLYRWGNPQQYRQGDESDRSLFFNHSTWWIPPGLPGEGHLMVFDNGSERHDNQYSTVLELELPYMEDLYGGAPWFAQGTDLKYADPDTVWHYSDPGTFYSNFVSGQQRLPNGNTLIAEGMTGRIFEITPEHAKVWEYVNPVVQAGPLSQGDEIPPFGAPGSVRLQNAVFRAARYATDFSAFDGRDLTPGGMIELGIVASAPALTFTLEPNYPNPFEDRTTVRFSLESAQHANLTVVDLLGREVATLAARLHTAGTHEYNLDARSLPSGVYLLRLQANNGFATRTLVRR